MVTRTFLLQQIERSFLTIVFGLTLLGVIGCGNSRAEHDIKPVEYVVKSATETPIEPTKENTSASVGPIQASLELVNKPLIQATPVITPGEPPELPLVRLPEKNVNALRMSAEAKGIEFVELARENTAIYALPEKQDGVVFFLTPPKDSLGFSTKELAADPTRYATQMLGGLSVVRQVNDDLPALPPGDYVITLSPDTSKVIFTSTQQEFEFDAVVRALPRQPWLQPIAVITARQLCLSWVITQVCALVDTPLPDNLVNDLRMNAEILLADAQKLVSDVDEFFTFDSSIPDVAGVSALQRCDDNLNSLEGPNYGGCWATLTIAPAGADGLPIPSALREEPGTISTDGISLFNILEPIEEEAYCNDRRRVLVFGECVEHFNLPEPIPGVLPQIPRIPPQGQINGYLVYHVRSMTDPQVVEGVVATRMILFTLPYISYVIPSFDGVTVIGDAVSGSGPSGEDEASITVNFRNRFCTFWECRWVPRRGSWRSRWW